ncbi:hypothetical protein EDB19DRAFT_1679160 [Suillus lakei]|nr:hypothetical protein EDB19DRAFT_1679160 [Suillus lakei]
MDQSGTLVFLLFLPLLWIVWLAMIISKPAIIFHISQIFFNFLAMACFASVASFQAKWGIGPSGLSGFALFVSISGIFLALFLLFVPVVYEKYDKLTRLARALKEVRVGFILVGSGLHLQPPHRVPWTEAGCKNADNDPHASLGDTFKAALPGWCSTKKAGAIFFWLAFGFWLASLILLIIDWRSGNLTSPPRDTPFTRPDADIEEGEEVEEVEEEDGHSYQPVATNTTPTYPRQSAYDNSNASASPFADSNRLSTAPTNTSTTYLPNPRFSTADSSANRTSAYSTAPTTTTAPTTSTNTSYPASRPSMDAYGAFSDPAPSGFGGVSASYAPAASESGPGAPRVSRTMQYADPSGAGAGTGAPAPTSSSYEPYTGYR